ncbi:MAG: MarR family transcriptional regulator [Rhodospirillaceae bacterium]|nr:MarR family transcriptional regulator [Rhodospirillaceae bacterium]MBT7267331.1 MarR family transcriptional regulator [Rhodospirillaceae bacterium]
MRQRITEFDITTQQLATLMRLQEQGEVSQNNLGRKLDMKPATIHGIAKRLEKRGLIASRRSPEDQRLILVALTSVGQKLAKELRQYSEAASAKTMTPLNKSEQKTLKSLLDKLVVE